MINGAKELTSISPPQDVIFDDPKIEDHLQAGENPVQCRKIKYYIKYCVDILKQTGLKTVIRQSNARDLGVIRILFSVGSGTNIWASYRLLSFPTAIRCPCRGLPVRFLNF